MLARDKLTDQYAEELEHRRNRVMTEIQMGKRKDATFVYLNCLAMTSEKCRKQLVKELTEGGYSCYQSLSDFTEHELELGKREVIYLRTPEFLTGPWVVVRIVGEAEKKPEITEEKKPEETEGKEERKDLTVEQFYLQLEDSLNTMVRD